MDTRESLKQKILALRDEQFTGRLDIKTDQGKSWRLYFCLSKLVWADGGDHPYRNWQRLLSQFCPELNKNVINLQEAKQFECWNYHIIIVLLKHSLISKSEATNLIEEQIIECFFDILQAENNNILCYEKTLIPASFLWKLGLKVSVISLTIEGAIKQAQLKWKEWEKQGLLSFSPNLAPLIKNRSALEKQFTPKTYQKLCVLLNGKYSLRELALKLNKDLLKVTLWLKSYSDKGLMDFVELPDLLVKVTLIGVTNDYTVTKITSQLKKIACIDDSMQICQMMSHIVNNQGYDFIGIQDPMKALPHLIKSKPDLIFLDLVMPIVNGYEVCAQIRRVNQLKDVPVIILTGSDGVIDRLRCKIVGASAFLSKPIDEQKIVKKINYFFNLQMEKSQNTQTLNNDVRFDSPTLV